MTAVRSFRGLGCPQQALVFFVRCAAQNTMLVIFVALWRIFHACGICISRWLSMLRQRIWSYATYTLRRTDGGHTRSRSCVMPSIITLEIVIWYGAVIVLGVRQSGENISSIFITKIIMASLRIACENLHWIFDSLFVHYGEYLGST